MTADLDALRQEIRDLDRDIIEAAAKRTTLARRIGELKRSVGRPIRNYSVEAEVIRLAREQAALEGFPTDVDQWVRSVLAEYHEAPTAPFAGRFNLVLEARP